MRAVLALGGNALIRRGEPLDVDVQRANLRRAAAALAAVARAHQVVFTHGNGPQVGLLALQSESSRDAHPYPLDVLGAETEGMVGYLIEQELGRHLPRNRLATVLTQVVVDPEDDGFARPTKFVGPTYDEARSRALAAERGWTMALDGRVWRRVVASPEPHDVVELETIRLLVGQGVTVICAGGGGIPVVDDGDGLTGVDAVVDKDLSASLLADRLDADLLVLLTDVSTVIEAWGTAEARPILRASPTALRRLRFAPGSMGPKVEAACRFVERRPGRRRAAIGALDDVAAVVAGTAGTQVAAERCGGRDGGAR